MFRSITTLVIGFLLSITSLSAMAQNSIVPSTSIPVVVMTYNIQAGANSHDNPFFIPEKFDLPKVAAVIKTQNPDIIFLQEVDRFGNRSGKIDEVAVLSELLGMNSAFAAAIGDELDLASNNWQYGVAILSRYPILSATKYRLPDVILKNNKHSEPRVALMTTISVQGIQIRVATTHLGLLPNERLAQVQVLKGILANPGVPLIFGGDFNAEPEAPEIQQLSQGLVDPFTAMNLDKSWRLSYPSGPDSKKAIDYLLISPDITIQNIKVVPDRSYTSDHNPLVGYFNIPKPAPITPGNGGDQPPVIQPAAPSTSIIQSKKYTSIQ